MCVNKPLFPRSRHIENEIRRSMSVGEPTRMPCALRSFLSTNDVNLVHLDGGKLMMSGTDGALLTERREDVLLSRTSFQTRPSEPVQRRESTYNFKVGDRVRLSTLGKARCPRSVSTGRIASLVTRKRGTAACAFCGMV